MKMTFDEILKSKEHRNLFRSTKLYRRLRDMPDHDLEADVDSLDEDEEVLGIYENSPDDIRYGIIITTKGLHIFTNYWRRLEYGEIISTDVPLSEEKDKTRADEIEVTMQSGEKINIPIVGGEGRLRDAWPFLTFIGDVVVAFKRRVNS